MSPEDQTETSLSHVMCTPTHFFFLLLKGQFYFYFTHSLLDKVSGIVDESAELEEIAVLHFLKTSDLPFPIWQP